MPRRAKKKSARDVTKVTKGNQRDVTRDVTRNVTVNLRPVDDDDLGEPVAMPIQRGSAEPGRMAARRAKRGAQKKAADRPRRHAVDPGGAGGDPEQRGAAVRRPQLPAPAGVDQTAFAQLTTKQQLFVREYLVDLNGSGAARRAGYSADTAHSIAHENLRKPEVLLAIEQALGEQAGITRSRLVDELGAIAFSNIQDVVDWSNETERVGADIADSISADVETPETRDGPPLEEVRVLTNRVIIKPSAKIPPEIARAISKVSQDRYGNLRVEMHDKLAAITTLCKALGMFQEAQAGHVGDNVLNYSASIFYLNRPDGRPPPRFASPKTVGGSGDGSD